MRIGHYYAGLHAMLANGRLELVQIHARLGVRGNLNDFHAQ